MDSDDDIYDCMLESSVKLVYDRILPKLERQLPTKNFCKGAFQLGIIDYDKVLTASHEHISPDINRKILEYIDSEQLDDIKDWLSIMFDDEKCRPIAYEFINELSEWKLEELVENINIKDGYILISDKLISVSKLDSVQMDVDEPVIIIQDSISRKSFPINKDHSVDVPIHAEDIKHKVNVSVPFPIHYRPMSTEIDIFPLVTRFTAMASASLVIKTWLQLPDSTSDQGSIRDCQLTCWIPHYKQIKQLFCKSEKSVQQNDKIIVARRINSDSTKFTEIGTKFSIDENKATDDGVVVKCNCSYQSVINWFWKIPQWLLDAARLGPKYYYDYFRYPVQYFVGVKPMKDKPGHFTLIALVKNIRCPLPSRIGDELELLASSGDETRLLSSGRLQINLAGDIKPLNGLIWVELLNKIAYFDGMYSVTQFACMGHFDADNGIYSKGSVEFRYIDPGPNCHPDASNPDYNVENESVVVEFSYAIDHEMTRKYSIIRGNVSDPETTGKVDARSPQPDPFTDTPMHNSKELSQNLSLIDSIEDTRHLWYQEDMTKVNAIVFLQDQPIGTFVVRKSTRHHCEAISVKVTVDGNIGHFLFKNNSNEWSIADFERKFVSLEDLLTHYTNNKDKELQVKLRFPRPIHSNAKVELQTQSLPGEISDCTMQHVSIQDYNEVSNLEKFEYILSDSEENTAINEGEYVYMKSFPNESKEEILNQQLKSRKAVYDIQKAIRRVKASKSLWMKRNVDISTAEELLQQKAAGTFLVIATETSHAFVLLVKLKNDCSVVAKFRILSRMGDVRIDGFNQSFNTIDDLIGCYVCFRDKELKLQLQVIDDELDDVINEDIGQTDNLPQLLRTEPVAPDDLDSGRFLRHIGPTDNLPQRLPTEPVVPDDLDNGQERLQTAQDGILDWIYDFRGISNHEIRQNEFKNQSQRKKISGLLGKRNSTFRKDIQERNKEMLKKLFKIELNKCQLGPWDLYLHEVFIRLKKLIKESLSAKENQRILAINSTTTDMSARVKKFEPVLVKIIFSASYGFIYKYLKSKHKGLLKIVKSHMSEMQTCQNLPVPEQSSTFDVAKIGQNFESMIKASVPKKKLEYVTKTFEMLPESYQDLKTMAYSISKTSLSKLVYEADYIENLIDHEILNEESNKKAFVTFRNALLFLQKLDLSGKEYLYRIIEKDQEIVRVILMPDICNGYPFSQVVALDLQETISDLYKKCRLFATKLLGPSFSCNFHVLSLVDANNKLKFMKEDESKVQLAIYGLEQDDYYEAIPSEFTTFVFHPDKTADSHIYE